MTDCSFADDPENHGTTTEKKTTNKKRAAFPTDSVVVFLDSVNVVGWSIID